MFVTVRVQAGPSLQESDSQTHSREGLHWPSTDDCWLVAELGPRRLQSSVTEGTGFLTLEVLPCARQLTLRLSGPFPVYVTHPVSSSCQAEGRATEQRARPGREARILGKVPHGSRAASCFQEGMCFQACGGHSAQSQRRRGYPGVVQKATAKQPTAVVLCRISYMCV